MQGRDIMACVKWGPRAYVYCGQMAGWIKLVLGMEVDLSSGDFVLDGDPVPFPQKGAEPPPRFSAHFYCGQTDQCINDSFFVYYCVLYACVGL